MLGTGWIPLRPGLGECAGMGVVHGIEWRTAHQLIQCAGDEDPTSLGQPLKAKTSGLAFPYQCNEDFITAREEQPHQDWR
jgi:hypothetical protein